METVNETENDQQRYCGGDHLGELPAEITLHVLAFVPPSGLVALSRVSQGMHGLVQAPTLWRRLLRRDFEHAMFDGDDQPRQTYIVCLVASRGRFVHYDRVQPPRCNYLWDRPVFTAIGETPPRPGPTEYLDAVRKVYVNGGAMFARFSVSLDVRLDWFITRDRIEEIDFLKRFTRSDAVRTALAANWVQYKWKSDVLLKPIDESSMPRKLKWKPVEPVASLGENHLAGLLAFGGAYESLDKDNASASASTATAVLLDGRPHDQKIFCFYGWWCRWFYGIAWDVTFVGLDLGRREVWLLCATDTD